MEQTQDTANSTITAPTGLEAKAQTGEVEVRKGTGILVAELARTIRNAFESKDCRFRSDWDGDNCLEHDFYVNITNINEERLAYISTVDRETPFVHDRNHSPIYIEAYTPIGLEHAKVFAKSYKELTGQNAVIYQQFVPEDFVQREQLTAELEEIVEEQEEGSGTDLIFYLLCLL